MSIAFSQVASALSNNGNATTHSYTGNGLASVTSVTNGIAFVLFDSPGLGVAPTSVTWGGSAMTKIGQINQTTRNNTQSLWYILNPSSGAVTVADTYSSANPPNMIWGVYSGVAQTAPEASNTGYTATGSLAVSVTTLTANAWVFSAFTNNFGTGVAGANTTGRFTNVICFGDTNADVVTPSSQAQNWGGSGEWTGFSVSIAPTSSGITVTPSVQTSTFTIPAYTVVAERFVTVTPTTPSATFTIPNHTSSGGAGISAPVKTATFSIPAYTVSANGSITVTANLQTATFSIPAYTVSIVSSVTVAPSLQVCTFSIPTYTVTLITGVTVTPSVQALTLSIPTYRVIADYWEDKFTQPANAWGDKFTQPANGWNDKY